MKNRSARPTLCYKLNNLQSKISKKESNYI
jgi:hypothetical protein